MLIREHVWVLGKCIACGALRAEAYVSANDQRSCVWRDDYLYGKLLPEPKLVQRACEDAEVISTRIRELRKERDEWLERKHEDD